MKPSAIFCFLCLVALVSPNESRRLQKTFRLYGPEKIGNLQSESDLAFPHRFSTWDDGTPLELPDLHSTKFGYVCDGPVTLKMASGPLQRQSFTLMSNMYFSAPAACTLHGGKGFVAERIAYEGVFSMGGPIEEEGRLRYIDGCTDSLLLPPVRFGDACLNHIHFPRTFTKHSTHTQAPGYAQDMNECPDCLPKDRVGRTMKSSDFITIPLRRGDVFSIPADLEHSFATARDEQMCIIAFHPDSDFGPRDECHPMINRTIISGRSAALSTADARDS